MDTESRFDIFSGTPDKDAVWVECVLGLSNARGRMEQIAAQKPGRYFLFSLLSHSVLSKTETFSKPKLVSTKSNSAT
jgi:hypothetical protein